MHYVYTITNKNSSRVYVGWTKDIKQRWNGHKDALLKKAHYNDKLQYEWDKDGPSSFEWAVVFQHEDKAVCKAEESRLIKTLPKVHNRQERVYY